MIKRFFYDFEFEEKRTPIGVQLDVISFGMIDESERTLYLINKDYDWNYCKNPWLFTNVKEKLHAEKGLVIPFNEFKQHLEEYIDYHDGDEIKLFARCCAYDHVCLGSIFGAMINFPSYLSYFTNEIKQIEEANFIPEQTVKEIIKQKHEHCAIDDARFDLKIYQFIESL